MFGIWGGRQSGNVVYDYEAHDNAMNDPELWTVKAEERRAWTTEAVLIDNNPNISRPIVTPFSVRVPAVNYPPVNERYRQLGSSAPLARHSYSDLSYRYYAVVTYTDGRVEKVPAGYTTFVPASSTRPTKTPFTGNTTFREPLCRNIDSLEQKKRDAELNRCLPAPRSTFVAEVTFEEGNIIQRGSGRPVKGRVTVHSTGGSTTMSDISVSYQTVYREHWAEEQAATGGDDAFSNFTSSTCVYSGGQQALSPVSIAFSSVFETDAYLKGRVQRLHPSRSQVNGPLTAAKPYFDFELDVAEDMPIDFPSYYGTGETILQLTLTALYSHDVAKCMGAVDELAYDAEDETALDDAAGTEEGLWDSWTPVGEPRESQRKWRSSIPLRAEMPVTIVGNAPASARPIEHYLKPGVASPVIVAPTAQAHDAIPFPVPQPVVTEEAFVNTSARLMQPGTNDPFQAQRLWMNMSRFYGDYPDPTKDYHYHGTGVYYAGLLWRKKVVAEERGIFPLQPEKTSEDGRAQQPFVRVHSV
ncbi:hypothetical protein B0H10DRAFT_1131597 [Mycena sp. CBHHK59/15]|nr:hypothetical protein B0H10DRAFT_1131597 [Mycena sp. CBHHK59/15]